MPAKLTTTIPEARALAEEAYIFAYPMLENYKALYFSMIDRDAPSYAAPLNQFIRHRQLVGPEFRAVVRPNNDTIYVNAGLDLRTEPIVLVVPADPDRRYYTMQLVDMYTHNFAYVGTRATGFGAGTYLIAGPGWREGRRGEAAGSS